MAYCRIVETGVQPEEYDKVSAELGVGDSPPAGASVHIAGRGEDGKMRVIEVWESRDEAEAWGEKVLAAREKLGVTGSAPPSIVNLEVHRHVQA